ncbi:hypothetical protein P4E94_15910 [Pontiellaceae bacterium B12219]|nr:hypothetical protein [Pontiellaceae bacterium B12219]
MKFTRLIFLFVVAVSCVPTGEASPYAEAVIDSYILTGNVGNSQTNVFEALGAPDEQEVSLGGPGGWIMLDMGPDDLIVNGPGADLQIREIGAAFGGQDESYEVYISETTNLVDFVFAGTGRAISLFDIQDSGLSSARYVRIVDLATETLHTTVPGSDIDSVTSLQSSGLPAGGTNLQARLTGQGIFLQWQQSGGDNADAFNIRRSLDGVSYSSTPLATLVSGETAYHDVNVPGVTDLWYAVSSVSGSVESAASVVQVPTYSMLVSDSSSVIHLGDNVTDWEVGDPDNDVVYQLVLARDPQGPEAKLTMDLFDVDQTTGYLFVNGAKVGSLLSQPSEAWVEKSMVFDAGVLRGGTNTVSFHARDSSGGTTGSLDDYMVRNVSLQLFGTGKLVALPWSAAYSPTLNPPEWEIISEPILWKENATNSTGFFRLQKN